MAFSQPVRTSGTPGLFEKIFGAKVEEDMRTKKDPELSPSIEEIQQRRLKKMAEYEHKWKKRSELREKESELHDLQKQSMLEIIKNLGKAA